MSAFEDIRKMLRENLFPGDEPARLTDQNIAIIRYFDERLSRIEAQVFPSAPEKAFIPNTGLTAYQKRQIEVAKPKYDQEG
jgi:hypothetical protein